MGGRVWVESELGRGSAFHFTAHLPVQADAPERSSSAIDVTLSGVRALVVDDNFTNRFILHEMLTSRGAEVDEAEDGPTALARIERAKAIGASYKLLLIDCRMPDMDGFEVAERVKGLGEPGLTVMMLSSDDLKVQQTKSHELGLDAYLVKPVSRGDLFEAIGTAMSMHSAGTELHPPGNALMTPSVPVDSTTTDVRIDHDRPVTILLADDSTDNRLLIHAYLKDATIYHLDDAENGAIALAKVKAGRYDLVLMDIQMPVMDGLEATRAIRTWEHEEHRAPTPVIALTASALDEDVRRTLEAGIDMHVSKPIKKQVLVAAIKKSLRPRPVLTMVKKPADAAA
jgi:CheY-like chemotaxis protein